MNNDIGLLIKKLRSEKGLTQKDFAERLHVSDKTVSKWERGDGYPDIEMLKPICHELGISVDELFDGMAERNSNISGNMLKSKFYVCPVCGNIIVSSGDASVICHGLKLKPLEAIEDKEHIHVEKIQDQYYVTVDSNMTKDDYITFIAALRSDGVEIKKLYPESIASAYFRIDGVRYFYVLDSKGEFTYLRKGSF